MMHEIRFNEAISKLGAVKIRHNRKVTRELTFKKL
jgi:hypothetical protein